MTILLIADTALTFRYTRDHRKQRASTSMLLMAYVLLLCIIIHLLYTSENLNRATENVDGCQKMYAVSVRTNVILICVISSNNVSRWFFKKTAYNITKSWK